jgi:hypothetical protein
MTDKDSKQPSKEFWDRFDSDVKGLAGELRRHYRDASDPTRPSELSRSLERLGHAAGAVLTSVENATRDPQVRSRTREAARSFGSALAETVRDLGDDLGRVIRKPPGPQ